MPGAVTSTHRCLPYAGPGGLSLREGMACGGITLRPRLPGPKGQLLLAVAESIRLHIGLYNDLTFSLMHKECSLDFDLVNKNENENFNNKTK